MAAIESTVLSRLSRSNRAALIDVSEVCNLSVSELVVECDSPIRNVFFPLSAVLCAVGRTKEYATIGLGLVGSEGIVGAETAIGLNSHSIRMSVQGAGSVVRVGVASLRGRLLVDADLRFEMIRYGNTLFRQVARFAACAHAHEIGPRLARWLLISQDRAQSKSFHVTQEYLAQMLGVRRVGVTGAASALQRIGLIRYDRGDLTVLNRSGLKMSACSCYAADQRAWSHRRNLPSAPP